MADLRPLEALADEAADETQPAAFEFGGQSFALPERLDLRAVAALQRGDFNRALSLVLGKEQAAKLIDLETDEPFDETAIGRLFEAVAGSQGTSRGESSASPRS